MRASCTVEQMSPATFGIHTAGSFRVSSVKIETVIKKCELPNSHLNSEKSVKQPQKRVQEAADAEIKIDRNRVSLFYNLSHGRKREGVVAKAAEHRYSGNECFEREVWIDSSQELVPNSVNYIRRCEPQNRYRHQL